MYLLLLLLLQRMSQLVAKGCNAVAPYHTDAYQYPAAAPITLTLAKSYLTWLSTTARRLRVDIALVDTAELAGSMARYFDLAVTMEAYKLQKATAYNGFVTGEREPCLVSCRLCASLVLLWLEHTPGVTAQPAGAQQTCTAEEWCGD